MITNKKVFSTLLLSCALLTINGCSNLDVGFEKESVFYSDESKDVVENSVVNVYLDPSTQEANKFRLVINGEDTELDLYYDVITRFGIDKKNTTIDLLKNNAKVMRIQLNLQNRKNYFLAVKKDASSGQAIIVQIDKHTLDKGTKATPIFVSEKVAKADEVKQVQKIQKQVKQEKEDFVVKKSIGVQKSEELVEKKIVKEKTVTPAIKKTTAPTVSTSEVSAKKSLQERYEAGEAIFYYDPDDGE